jgi:hypothetical protein
MLPFVEHPDWSPPTQADPTPTTRPAGTGSGGWGRPSDEARQRAAADRYTAGDSATPNYPGFHTYAANPEPPADSGSDDDRWPDNWPDQRPDGESDEADEGSDDQTPSRRDYLQPLLWTAFWLMLPLLGLLVQALLQSGEPVAGCVAGLAGCDSPRVEALGDLIANSPRWLLATLTALTVATVLRWASDAWRAVTIGFCSAVVAGGVMTILTSM